MKKQSYSNHKRYLWWFHGLLFGVCIATLIGSVVNLIDSLDGDGSNLYSASLVLMCSIILLIFFFTIRYFAVRLQDRMIRAEENYRHITLTGKPLDHRLHTKQIIALRFAPDDEFPRLCQQALEKHLSNEEIKKAIHRWRGDYHRI